MFPGLGYPQFNQFMYPSPAAALAQMYRYGPYAPQMAPKPSLPLGFSPSFGMDRLLSQHTPLSTKAPNPSAELYQRLQYQQLLHQHAAAVQQQQVAEEIERRRLTLVEADRQVRILEKLAEKKLEEHQALELQTEMKDLDEQAIQGFNRQHEEALP